MENNYKQCSIEAMRESIKLARNYRDVVLSKAQRCQRVIRRLNAEFDECPSIELNERIMDWEYRYFKMTQEISELSTAIMDMKYEILSRYE